MQPNSISSPKFKVSRFNPYREHLKTQIAHTSLLTLKPRASLPKIQKNTSQISQRSEIPLLKMQTMGSPLNQSFLLEMEKVYCVWHSETGIVGGEQKKHNQDAILVQNMKNYQLFIVCDGHGSSGHLVSNYVLNTLIQQIEQGMQRNQYMLQYNTQLHKTVIKGAFAKTSSLLEQSSLPIIRSGCTCNIVMLLQQNIVPADLGDFQQEFQKESVVYCANVGDSRAMMVSRGIRGGLIINQLSMDHRLDVVEEKNRIKQKGGTIAQLQHNGQSVGPYRVWLDEMQGSGLAMSRSFGDTQMQSVGVTSEPTIYEQKVRPQDLFMVIASDGIWEYMTNQQVAKLVYEKYEQQDQAAQYLVQQAQQQWKENDVVVDDISCIVVFFNQSL
ncbi:unnamed protein product [Paramecium pentaurelia]|uniref:PPM-type phosphatase domain-containing protein n=1 Tax=Paramecium pentaurelia TaxID=43138 RepID=A0A8S1Y656_9CILI|nr:unnamed protein product [Paramecium pentaurelia]